MNGTTTTRRTFLTDVGRAGAGVAGLRLASPGAAPARRNRQRGPTVAVLGGGIAGLTAAHELAERGFRVTVYERRAWGGKARSTNVPGSARGGRRPLPGEHGFRAEFGFYQNLPETMRRIPWDTGSVFERMVPGAQLSFARAGKRDLVLPLESPDPRPYTPRQVIDLIVGVLLETNLPPEAVAHFANRMLVFLSSCDARRLGQWEKTTWTDFIGADRYTDDYRKVLALPYSQFTQSSRPEGTSAKYVGWLLELAVHTTLGRGANGPLFRMLDLPTNEAWIDPWTSLLRKLGVQLRLGCSVNRLDLQDGRLTGARIRTRRGIETVRADWYVCALPVERARRLWNPAILHADPRLHEMWKLETAYMNGMQFYLREPTPIVRGHVICLDSPWAVESISQAQFWDRDFARTYGDGSVHDCLSAIVADWTTPGVLFGKPARNCTPREIAREAWEQIKRHVNDTGRTVLSDDLVVAFALDPGMRHRKGQMISDDPLVLPSAGAWDSQPDVSTAIPNLMLAGDYLRGDWEVANMEAANCNARRAVNAILEQSRSYAAPCSVLSAYRAPEWEPLRRMDEDRFRRGRSNLFDLPQGVDRDLLDTLPVSP